MDGDFNSLGKIPWPYGKGDKISFADVVFLIMFGGNSYIIHRMNAPLPF